VNLPGWASHVGVEKHTAYRWSRDGTLPVPARRAGRLVLVDAGAPEASGARAVAYARVPSHDQRADVDRQVARLAGWATGNGLAIGEVVAEAGSGVDGKRRELAKLLAGPTATTLVVEHRDRLACSGVEHLEAALSGPRAGRSSWSALARSGTTWCAT
jgi:putative resolvase